MSLVLVHKVTLVTRAEAGNDTDKQAHVLIGSVRVLVQAIRVLPSLPIAHCFSDNSCEKI